jgi:outer membrane receptor protein involved in Fe transport
MQAISLLGVAGAWSALSLGFASTASAQAAAERLERIEITGSRLPTSSDIDTPSPVAIVRAEDIRLEGYQSLELVLNNYPQFVADQGNRVSNGASGTATADLRGLGAQRTLVLLNGRRMPAGTRGALSPDLNQIPPQLIQRVEILTGGASAVYGADAIAGVVNFIMDDRFEGAQGDVAYGFYNHRQKNGFVAELLREREIPVPGDKSRDGGMGSASLTLGGAFAGERGHAVVSLRYLKAEALAQSERDYSACALSLGPGPTACGGSFTGNPGLIVDRGFFVDDLDVDPRPPRLMTIDRASGRVRNFRPPGDLYNFAPLNYYQRPQERYGFNAFAHYDFAPETRLYAESGFHDDRSLAQIAASGMFSVPVLVRWENPLLSDEWRSNLVFRDAQGNVATGPGTVANVVVLRRNTEGGGRQDDLRHVSFRQVLGLKGTAWRWDYDAFVQASRVNFQNRYSNDFSGTRSRRALDVTVDPATGAPVCVSVLTGADPGCVPYNVWSLDSVTDAALAYVQVPAFQRATLSQHVAGATASANLGDFGIRLPRTRGAIEVALGIERRREKLDFEADPQFADLAGQGQPILPIKGGFTVDEVFGEVRVPILDLASVSASYRWSDYDSGVKTDTYGIGFNASPSKLFRVRGSYQRAVRAPNVNELFAPQFPAFYGLEAGDPCAGEAPTRSLADCARTGVTVSRYGRILDSPSGEFPATAGGNPRLQPETARTYTVGIVLTPSRDLSATIDYFDVRLEDAISAVEASVIFQQCLDTGNPLYCDLVSRDPASQSLWFGQANVVAVNRNIGKTRVAGADVGVTYRLRLPKAHAVSVDMLGTFLRSQTIQRLPEDPMLSCEGLFVSACSILPLPRWRHRLRATWQPPTDLRLTATWRYIGGTRTDLEAFTPDAVRKLPGVSYFDLAATWSATRNLTLRVGVNNVADRDPPVTFGFGYQFNGNTFAQMYDALGRHVFASATARF